MREDDFWIEVSEWDPLVEGTTTAEQLNVEMLDQLRLGPVEDHSDIEVAVALALLVHDEFQKYGTDKSQRLTTKEARLAVRALLAVLKRLGVDDVDIPFSDFDSFYSHWIRKGASGSWQARRDILADIFDGLHEHLADMEANALTSSLADAVSPHGRTGWARVDAEIAELKRHFAIARTEQDHRNVGNDCVIITEALAKIVYDPAIHVSDDEEPLPAGKTKQRLDRFVVTALPGSDNAELRRFAKAAIELAQTIKHRSTPSRRDAGIAADAVILLANMMRRLAAS